MAKSQDLLAAVWSYCYDKAPDTAASFWEELKAFRKSATERILAGSLTSLSAFGRSSQFAGGDGPDYSPSDILNAANEACQLYQSIASDLGFVVGETEGDDELAIFQDGDNNRIAGVSSFRRDHSTRRLFC